MIAVPVICAVRPCPWRGSLGAGRRVPGNEPLRPLPGVRTRGWYLFLYLALAVLFTLMGHRFDDAPALVVIGYLGSRHVDHVSVIDIQCYRLPIASCCPPWSPRSCSWSSSPARRCGLPHQYALAGAAIYFLFLLVVHLISPRAWLR